MPTRIARLKWLPPSEGGLSHPPSDGYSTVARFEKIRDKWLEEGWSIVLRNMTTPTADGEMTAEVSLLMGDEGPAELLEVGERFDLFEGARLVAEGEIIE